MSSRGPTAHPVTLVYNGIHQEVKITSETKKSQLEFLITALFNVTAKKLRDLATGVFCSLDEVLANLKSGKNAIFEVISALNDACEMSLEHLKPPAAVRELLTKVPIDSLPILSEVDKTTHNYPMAWHLKPPHEYVQISTVETDFIAPKRTVSVIYRGNRRKLEVYAESADEVEVTNVMGVDCEMIRSRHGVVLARVTVVNAKFDVIYDSLVKSVAESDVVDYLTRFSGITRDKFAAAKMSLCHIHADLRALLSVISGPAVLVGHSLESDLHALKIVFDRVVDTAILYPFAFDRTPGPRKFRKRRYEPKHALRDLCRMHLGITIQASEGGHNSGEDAAAALRLLHHYMTTTRDGKMVLENAHNVKPKKKDDDVGGEISTSSELSSIQLSESSSLSSESESESESEQAEAAKQKLRRKTINRKDLYKQLPVIRPTQFRKKEPIPLPLRDQVLRKFVDALIKANHPPEDIVQESVRLESVAFRDSRGVLQIYKNAAGASVRRVASDS